MFEFLSWRFELELESGMFRSSVLSWRDELELESGIGDLRILYSIFCSFYYFQATNHV